MNQIKSSIKDIRIRNLAVWISNEKQRSHIRDWLNETLFLNITGDGDMLIPVDEWEAALESGCLPNLTLPDVKAMIQIVDALDDSNLTIDNVVLVEHEESAEG